LGRVATELFHRGPGICVMPKEINTTMGRSSNREPGNVQCARPTRYVVHLQQPLDFENRGSGQGDPSLPDTAEPGKIRLQESRWAALHQPPGISAATSRRRKRTAITEFLEKQPEGSCVVKSFRCSQKRWCAASSAVGCPCSSNRRLAVPGVTC